MACPDTAPVPCADCGAMFRPDGESFDDLSGEHVCPACWLALEPDEDDRDNYCDVCGQDHCGCAIYEE